jgi:predicted transcriptional regulator
MDATPQLTPLQLDVLRILWERGEATVNDVTDALRAERGLAPTTVATLLARLERRGVVKRRRVDRQYRYAARVARTDAQRALVDELAKHLFDGDLGGLVHHLVSRDEIGPDDLARLRRLIDAKDPGRGKS